MYGRARVTAVAYTWDALSQGQFRFVYFGNATGVRYSSFVWGILRSSEPDVPGYTDVPWIGRICA